MGYEIRVNHIKFGIEKEHFAAVLQAIGRIPDRLAWTNRESLHRWCNLNEISKDINIDNYLEAMMGLIFDELMWPIDEYDESGNIISIEYAASDRKIGDEAIWMEAIAPYVDSGSYIEVYGEDDGDLWRWCFVNGKFYEVRPEITWKMPE